MGFCPWDKISEKCQHFSVNQWPHLRVRTDPKGSITETGLGTKFGPPPTPVPVNAPKSAEETQLNSTKTYIDIVDIPISLSVHKILHTSTILDMYFTDCTQQVLGEQFRYIQNPPGAEECWGPLPEEHPKEPECRQNVDRMSTDRWSWI